MTEASRGTASVKKGFLDRDGGHEMFSEGGGVELWELKNNYRGTEFEVDILGEYA